MILNLRLKETTLDQLLKFSRVLISCHGLTLEQPPCNMSWMNRFKYCVSIFFSLLVFYISPTYHIVLGLESNFVEVFSILISGSMYFNKAFWFYINRNEISTMCSHARIVESATGVPSRDLKRAAVTNLFFISTIIFIVTFIIFDLLLSDERTFPVPYSTFPGLHPALKSPNYEISLCIYGWGITLIMILCTGYRMLFASLIEYSAARIRLIGAHLEQLNSTESKSLRDPTKLTLEEPLRSKLGRLINRHTDVTVLVNMMRKIYDTVIGIDFALIFVALTTVLMNIENSDTMLSIRLIIYLLGELLMYCYCGQNLIDANEDLQRSIYACGWEEWANEKDLRRAVLVMLRSAQRLLRLTAARKWHLSHDTFQAVIRSCYSFTAALNAKN